jgi:hypothetical protein
LTTPNDGSCVCVAAVFSASDSPVLAVSLIVGYGRTTPLSVSM